MNASADAWPQALGAAAQTGPPATAQVVAANPQATNANAAKATKDAKAPAKNTAHPAHKGK